MKIRSFFLLFVFFCGLRGTAQKAAADKADMRIRALEFLQSLSAAQKAQAQFPFTDEERYHWNFIPIDRKGLPVKDMNESQRAKGMALLQAALSDTGFAKTRAVMQLETVLKELENRSAGDHTRDPEKYFVSVFGNPLRDSLWGWRFEGHHVSFNFTSDERGLVSATPGFLGANPAVVPSGPQKGTEVLKEETALGFAFLHSLNESQQESAILVGAAPGEIVTGNSRKAMIENPQGIRYNELTGAQQKALLQLVQLYLHRYKPAQAATMLKALEGAGIANLRFAWAGADQPGIGHPHYYRIQSPTLLIEYDNTQNNANHVHTVVRDLVNDFGGDQLLEHYHHARH